MTSEISSWVHYTLRYRTKYISYYCSDELDQWHKYQHLKKHTENTTEMCWWICDKIILFTNRWTVALPEYSQQQRISKWDCRLTDEIVDECISEENSAKMRIDKKSSPELFTCVENDFASTPVICLSKNGSGSGARYMIYPRHLTAVWHPPVIGRSGGNENISAKYLILLPRGMFTSH